MSPICCRQNHEEQFCRDVIRKDLVHLKDAYGDNHNNRPIIFSLVTYRQAHNHLSSVTTTHVLDVIAKMKWICEISGDLDNDWYDRAIMMYRLGADGNR